MNFINVCICDLSYHLTLILIFNKITLVNQRRWEDGIIELVFLDLIKNRKSSGLNNTTKYKYLIILP